MSEKPLLYRPSNGTEGASFVEHFCFSCERDRDEDCDILARTYAFGVDDPRYPTEWQRVEGRPICLAYWPLGEPLPTPRCTRTADLFGESQRSVTGEA